MGFLLSSLFSGPETRRRTPARKTSRRTSRKPSPKPKRTSRVRGTVRKGYMKMGAVHAQEFKGPDPALRGRISLNRGAGVLEFPDVDQFRRIAREEGIAKEDVEKAFGHMKVVRNPVGIEDAAAGLRGLVKNAARGKRSIRKGVIFAPERRNGEPDPFYALEVVVPADFVTRVGAERGVMIDLGGGVIRLVRAVDGFTLAKPWVTREEYDKAFNHLMHKQSVLGTRRQSRGIPLYKARSMRLGHREGEAVFPGIARGQLVLFHKETRQIVWEAFDDKDVVKGKPVLLRLPGGGDGRTAHVDIPELMQGAYVGRGERRVGPVGAIDVGIPPSAVLQAFAYLIEDERARQEAYAVYSRPLR